MGGRYVGVGRRIPDRWRPCVQKSGCNQKGEAAHKACREEEKEGDGDGRQLRGRILVSLLSLFAVVRNFSFPPIISFTWSVSVAKG